MMWIKTNVQKIMNVFAICALVWFAFNHHLCCAGAHQIHIAGSSSIYPFAATVSERYAFCHEILTPIVESIGTGGGFKVFCTGVEQHSPDIATASRKITPNEVQTCHSRGIHFLHEIVLGFDGIVFVTSKEVERFSITKEQFLLALMEKIPIGGKLIKNPYVLWSDIDVTLPGIKIRIFGPTPSSGTRDALVDLMVKPACRALAKKFSGQLNCKQFRNDGAYIDVGANENIIIQKVKLIPGAIGIVSYSFLDQNLDRVHPLKIEGTLPSEHTIQDNVYPLSRPLFLYAKQQSTKSVPYLNNFLLEFMKSDVSGPKGYLTHYGLVPLKEKDHISQREKFMQGKLLITLSQDKEGQSQHDH